MDDQRPGRTLVNLQLRLIESKETNAEFSKQIDHLQVVKEELSQNLQKLKLSSKKKAIESLLEDREIVSLSHQRENALIKQKSLANDLRSARNLLRKFKLDIDCSEKSITNLEEQCALTKASIAATSGERKEVLKDIESIATKAEEQRLNIAGLSSNINEEKMFGERLKKRDSELKSIQVKLKQRQQRQEKQIIK
ncbi:hypothetical protein DAPPUDRAFT_105919 [Daphnia pulex]|uniref:Uncharacterized protein n=1 Tax=Daphnia pulex TaxID=6669 RepID=E9GS83_DAPPU|nr:hypothetical protein DAPPUDRAFT_105919 [Daphnia pulex]|eukprot:EFX77668.1 hypothetical protein DAPPUDRAFT_105919 [Daphnia pulex]